MRYPNSDRNAVEGISLSIEPGEFVVLLGPSGCGKSSLLRTVNRMVDLTSGYVSVGDRDVQSLDPTQLRRGIGYVIQAIGLFSHMTIAQNIAVVPTLLRWERSRITTRIDELLTLVGLDASRYRDRYPRQLSGGEQQRVGVARAIAAEPSVLLMDEPFGAVDAIVRATLQEAVLRIAHTLKTTILFVTHDVDEALRLADRIVVMKDGRVVQYDTPLQILSRPAAVYVEQLLDTKDVIRQLSLLAVRDAMRPSFVPLPDASNTTETRPHSISAVSATSSLRDSLNTFLSGEQTLTVIEDGRSIGTLTFDDVRTALRKVI
ncbi:MAG: ABC transporter ATP-binding protein [Candidatus Baltobacteraceae bacterium]